MELRFRSALVVTADGRTFYDYPLKVSNYTVHFAEHGEIGRLGIRKVTFSPSWTIKNPTEAHLPDWPTTRNPVSLPKTGRISKRPQSERAKMFQAIKMEQQARRKAERKARKKLQKQIEKKLAVSKAQVDSIVESYLRSVDKPERK